MVALLIKFTNAVRAEAGHAGGPAEGAGGHRQRRWRQPWRRRWARAVGWDPADARLAVPAAAAVIIDAFSLVDRSLDCVVRAGLGWVLIIDIFVPQLSLGFILLSLI
jgi:hypothetical protein